MESTRSSSVKAANRQQSSNSSSTETEKFGSMSGNGPSSGFSQAAVAVAFRTGSEDKSVGGSGSGSGSGTEDNDAGVIAAPASSLTAATMESGGPAEIPPEPGNRMEEAAADKDGNDREDEEEEEDESEYEYEDDDDAAFSGFLIDHAPLAVAAASEPAASAAPEEATRNGSAEAPARIRDEEESVAAAAAAAVEAPKSKWREPSVDAVKMSLRAEREKTGSKRRLAQDLYRIMNQDTNEAGFSIAPKSEDNMDHWTIKLFKFDKDSNLAKDMLVLGFEHIELDMSFPDQYPFEPPFVRVVRPRFKRQTGFVMNGALCMELLTKDGWNPVNDIESVIVSIRSLLVVGDGRLQAAHDMSETKYLARLKAAQKDEEAEQDPARKRLKTGHESDVETVLPKEDVGSYSMAEAKAAYSHLSDYHKKKGWDSSGWWARKG